jgi:hypothetical protein
MNNTNNMSARMSYDTARQVLFNSWIASFGGDAKRCTDWVNNRKLSQGDIRCEVGLTTAGNIFTFGVTTVQDNTQGIKFNTEKRLTQQDSLVVSEYGIFVAQPGSEVDTEYDLLTYGNPNVFAAADAAALNGTFYSNGGFSMRVNNDVIIPFRGLLNHWYKPQTQQTAALGPASPQDQFRGAEDGFITQEPNLLLIGSKAYVPQIELPAALSSAAEFLRCVLIFRGILAQNSTVIN